MKQKIFLLFLLVAFTLTACKWEQKRELSHNREIWQAQNVANYRYHVSVISYWGANQIMPLTVVVKNGTTASVMDKDGNQLDVDWERLVGIDAIFQEVEDALSRRLRDVKKIEYDPIYGFPTSIEIYYHETGVGGEYTRHYTISDFQVLSDP